MINSAIPIESQNINFGGGDNTYTSSEYFSICFVLVDAAGRQFAPKSNSFSCSAGIDELPTSPPSCTLNKDLDVNLGSLERSAISTSAGGGTLPTTKKNVDIICTGNSVLTADFKFQFVNEANFGGTPVISSDANGLGVAILYKGQAISPLDTLTFTYALGQHSLPLEFEAIRDPAVDIKDVPTGSFIANAVLVMTEH